MTNIEIKRFITYLTGVQNRMQTFRKGLSVKNDDEWNSKAQLVFTSEHIGCVKRNLTKALLSRTTTVKP